MNMKDIAKALGVSQPTVSRVLNGKTNVKLETKQMILDYIEEVGYRPNLLARSLKQNNSKLIGLCVPDLSNPYFVEVTTILEKLVRKNGYSIIIKSSNQSPILEWESIMDLSSLQVAGIIFIPCSSINLDSIKSTKIPTTIITQVRDLFDSVSISHIKGGALAANWMIKSGHTNIGYLGSDSPNSLKFKGFKEALNKNNFNIDSSNIIRLSEFASSNEDISRDIYEFLKKIDQVSATAFFAANDVIALEAIKAFKEKGYRIPEDISIIGFDDTIIAKLMGISSIGQPIEDITKMGYEYLLQRIEESSKLPIRKTLLEPTLVVRGSSLKKI